MNLITFYKDEALGWMGQMLSPVNQFILISNPFPLEFNDLKYQSPIGLKLLLSWCCWVADLGTKSFILLYYAEWHYSIL